MVLFQCYAFSSKGNPVISESYLFLIDRYEDLKTYFGSKPCQRFRVIEHEHPGFRRQHLVKHFVKKVFAVDIIDCIVFIKINLKDKRTQKKALCWNSTLRVTEQPYKLFSVTGHAVKIRSKLYAYHKWPLVDTVMSSSQLFKGVLQNQCSPQVQFKQNIFRQWELVFH